MNLQPCFDYMLNVLSLLFTFCDFFEGSLGTDAAGSRSSIFSDNKLSPPPLFTEFFDQINL
jgi:hypothetical protein